MHGFAKWNEFEMRKLKPILVEDMLAPTATSETGFNLELMTSIFWEFQKEIWYDPSVEQEVMDKLWLRDGEVLYDGWKNLPPVQGITDAHVHVESLCTSKIPNKVILIMTIVNIDGVYSTKYLFKNVLELDFYGRKFVCNTYEDNKTFLELRNGFRSTAKISGAWINRLNHFESEERKEREYRQELTYKKAIAYCESFAKQMVHPTAYSNGLKTVWLPEGFF